VDNYASDLPLLIEIAASLSPRRRMILLRGARLPSRTETTVTKVS